MRAALLQMLPEAMEQPLAELDAMRRMLEVSRGTFSLSIAVCNNQGLRDYLIRRQTEKHPGISVVSVSPETKDPYGFVTTRLVRCAPMPSSSSASSAQFHPGKPIKKACSL